MRIHQDDPRGDRGQVAVEFAGMVPLILLTLALLWQVVLVGYTYTLAGNAADEGARACAVGDDYREAALRHLDGAWAGGADPNCDTGGGMATVVVDVKVPVLVPGLGSPFEVRGKAGVILEEAGP